MRIFLVNLVKLYFLITLLLQLASCGSKSVNRRFDNYLIKNQCEKAANRIPIDRTNTSFLEDTLRVSSTIGSYAITVSAFTAGTIIGLAGNRSEVGYSLAKYSHVKTKGMRCPDIDDVSENIRRVGKCYLRRQLKDDTKKALILFSEVKSSVDFYSCLSDKERENFDNQMKEAYFIATEQEILVKADKEVLKPVALSSQEKVPKKCQFKKQVYIFSPPTGVLWHSLVRESDVGRLLNETSENKADMVKIIYQESTQVGFLTTGNLYQCLK